MSPLRTALLAGLAALAVLSAPPAARAHELPADVVVRALVKPEPGRLRLLVRVPLASMRDVTFPTRALGYLDLAATRPMLAEQADLWIAQWVELFEDDARLAPPTVVATRISLPTDASFAGWESALAHTLADDLPDGAELVVEQAMLDVLLEVPIRSPDGRFSIAPSWSHLGVSTSTVLLFVPPSGGERLYRYHGNPGVVRLDPRWHQAVLRFVEGGFRHVLAGIDHLLFLLCLAIPARRLATLVPIVTAFTVAHSITLIAAATGAAPTALWFPALVETLIAFSIVWAALDNVVRTELKRRWMLAFGFGLVHGFGFSFVLGDEIQFAGGHALSALLAFNVGVELGQLFALLLALPALVWLFRRVPSERVLTIVLSVVVAHTAWHWMTTRGAELLTYPIALPSLASIPVDALLRWAMVAVIAAGAAWGLSLLFGWWEGRRGAPPQSGYSSMPASSAAVASRLS